jgi:hypothetical protein
MKHSPSRVADDHRDGSTAANANGSLYAFDALVFSNVILVCQISAKRKRRIKLGIEELAVGGARSPQRQFLSRR